MNYHSPTLTDWRLVSLTGDNRPTPQIRTSQRKVCNSVLHGPVARDRIRHEGNHRQCLVGYAIV